MSDSNSMTATEAFDEVEIAIFNLASGAKAMAEFNNNVSEAEPSITWIIDKVAADAEALATSYAEACQIRRAERDAAIDRRKAVPEMIPDLLATFDLVGRPEGVDTIDAKIETLRASLDAYAAMRAGSGG